jgi:hypothetical protein
MTAHSQTLRLQVVDFVDTGSQVVAGVCQDLGDCWTISLLALSTADFNRLIEGGVTLAEVDAACIDSHLVEDDSLCVEVCADWRQHPTWKAAERTKLRGSLHRAMGKPAATGQARKRV